MERNKLAVALLVALSLIAFVISSMEVFTQPVPHSRDPPPCPAPEGRKASADISGASGAVFKGERVRKFTAPLRFADTAEPAAPWKATAPTEAACTSWAVVTTIFSPSDAVRKFRDADGWCLVVVLDRKAPEEEYLAEFGENPRVTVLTVAAQERLAESDAFVALVPWNHFGRKNIGYLHAIRAGAQLIFDFDDDNALREGVTAPRVPATFVEAVPAPPCHAANIYPRMGGPATSWPRGYPLGELRAPCSAGFATVAADGADVAVFQSLANHDPDVDAIYRLTPHPLPFDFEPSAGREGEAVVLPHGVFTPYNAQATLFAPAAYWSLLLPVTVPGRVSDIWRSFWAQRLMMDVGVKVAFTPPIVEQFRNAHNYLGDFASENHLYTRADFLVRFLGEWNEKGKSLPALMELLMVELYERDIVEYEDVIQTQNWIAALQKANYAFPKLTGPTKARPTSGGAPTTSLDPSVSGTTSGDAATSGSSPSDSGTKERVTAVLGFLSHSSRNKDGVSGYDRRMSVRESFWKWAESPRNRGTVIVRFVMDENPDDEVVAENDQFNDIVFLRTQQKGQAVSFGQKWTEWVIYATSQWEYDWLGRVDDDTFVCLDHLLYEMRAREPVRTIWGWFFVSNYKQLDSQAVTLRDSLPGDDNIYSTVQLSPLMSTACSEFPGKDGQKRPDEMFLVITGDVARWWGSNPDLLRAHRTGSLIDKTVMRWLQEIKMRYFVDNARIPRTPSFSTGTYSADAIPPGGLNGFCRQHIAAHKAHPEMMRKLYAANLDTPDTYVIPKINPKCKQS